MGREEPAVSMDAGGKIVWARHNEVLTAVVKPGGTHLLKHRDLTSASQLTFDYRCICQGW